jgi:hypothetical protein
MLDGNFPFLNMQGKKILNISYSPWLFPSFFTRMAIFLYWAGPRAIHDPKWSGVVSCDGNDNKKNIGTSNVK